VIQSVDQKLNHLTYISYISHIIEELKELKLLVEYISEKDLYDKYDYVSRVYCVKPYKTIVPGRSYQIKGRGNLEFNADPEVNGRKGYVLCIEDEWVNSDRWKIIL
jgi:hypothetical protein